MGQFMDLGMVRLKLGVQYAGTPYAGWQVQHWERPEGGVQPTIEGALQHAWERLTDGLEARKTFHVAGRTDAGVHAWAQVCHIDTTWRHALDTIKVLGGLNRFLPLDIRVVRVAVVGEDFHARFGAIDRSYAYLLYNKRSLRPDLAGRAGHVPLRDGRALDYMRMALALQALPLGAHDFSGFRDADCQSKRPVCALHWRELLDLGDGLYRLNIRADHFLHHMVRNLVGTLVEIGQGLRDTDNLATVLAGRQRALAGKTFTPDGLYLSRVGYLPHMETNVCGDV